MTKKRIATLATCLTLVGAVAVGGTLALLSSQSKQLTNTFTVGAGYDKDGKDFLLKEHGVTQDGEGNYNTNESDVIEGTVQGATNAQYNQVVDNSTLDKDPWFELVDLNAEDSVPGPLSWVVATVNVDDLTGSGLSITKVADNTKWALVTANSTDGGATWSYSLDMDDDNVDALEAADFKVNVTDGQNETKYYYIYTEKLQGNGQVNATTDKLFTQLSAGDIDETNFDVDVVVKGVAVQAVNGQSTITSQAVLDDVMAAAVSKLG